MAVKTLTIDGKLVSATEDQSLLTAAREAGIAIPTLCHLDGLSEAGACRLCLVEVAGQSKLQAACVTRVAEGMVVHTTSERLARYRKMIVELLFAEGNHTCAVCVANGHCELQQLAVAVGLDHVDLAYLHPSPAVDLSHERFGIDRNRCVLCTRCVRACDEIEGAHTFDVAGRGTSMRVITDLDQPWGQSKSCTSCGKCVSACPTGALFPQRSSVGSVVHGSQTISFLINAREKKQWNL